MSANLETKLTAHIQEKGSNGEIDVYRIDRERQVCSHETFASSKDAEIVLRERAGVAIGNIHESEIYLGVNIATTAILFVEALRHRSKLLMAASLASGATVIYANYRRQTHNKEYDWLEQEAIALENYRDDLIAQPRQ